MPILLSALVTGLLFGSGLAISGMTKPTKVLGFLDFTGNWDPSLLLVFGGAVAVAIIAFRFVLRQQKPVLANQFHLPQKTQIDLPLIAGSTIFGIGWGIGGYCPGPAIALLAIPTGREIWIFLPAMILGAILHKVVVYISTR